MKIIAKNIDMFGNEVEIVQRSRKTPTMQTMFGAKEGKKCKTCEHCYKKYWSARKSWYKCELWNEYFEGSSEASDIRLKNQACGKYKEKEE